MTEEILLALVLAFVFALLFALVFDGREKLRRWNSKRTLFIDNEYYSMAFLTRWALEGVKELGKRYSRVLPQARNQDICPDCGNLLTDGSTQKIIQLRSGRKFHESCLEKTKEVVPYYDNEFRFAKVSNLFHLGWLKDYYFPLPWHFLGTNYEEGLLILLSVNKTITPAKPVDEKVELWRVPSDKRGPVGEVRIGEEGKIESDFLLRLFIPRNVDDIILFLEGKRFRKVKKSEREDFPPVDETTRIFLGRNPILSFFMRGCEVRKVLFDNLKSWLDETEDFIAGKSPKANNGAHSMA
jgi:RNase P subunit RPR2